MQIRLTLKFFFCFLSVAICYATAGESGRIHFRRLSVNDGLSQNTVLALTQDHNGKIWVGTIDGLNWYDGYRFAPLYKDLNDSTSLFNNHVYSLCTDAEGTVWVGTLTGLSRYNIVGNNFTNYSLPEGLPVQIFAIEDLNDKGQLLLGTSNGLVVFDKKTGYMNPHPHLHGTTIYSICRINEGILLGSSSGAYHYRPQDNSVVRILPELKDEAISSIVYDPRKRTCWLGSFISGVYSMDEKFQIKEHYLYNDRQRQSPFESVRTLAQDDKGRIWIGTINALFILEPEKGTINDYTFSHEDENSLGHNSVRSILKDNQGGMWVGTFYGGLNYYHPMAPAFDTMTYSAYKNSISDNTVSCIVEDSRTGNLWIGTNDGGLNEYDRKKNHFTVYRANRNNPRALQSDNIKCALPDGNGVYIGSHGGGLSYLSGTGGLIENYTFPNAVSFNNSCYSLLDGKDGTLWAGSIIGLYRFDKKTKKLSLHPLAQKYPRLNSVLISVLYRDSKGRIWIGTEESLFVYANGKLEEWKDYTSKTPSLIQAFCIQEDSNHHIWIGSSVGLYKSPDGSTDHQIRYSTNDGLPNNFIYGVLEDGRGRLWITTNRGLSCFDPSEQTFLNYTVQDGLSHGQFNTYGACKTQDGIFFLGSLKGVTYFNPYEFVDNPFSPNAVITGATILNQPVTNIKDGVSKYFQASNGRLLGMSFPSNRKLFSIRFSVINYLSGRRNLFAYKLEGFDEDWVSSAQAISQRGATYSNLPPGKYIFKVRACNNNGRWSLTPTEFFVHITPMWYQTWWAKSIFILLILGGIAFILYFFIARAKMKMQMQIDHLERNKIEEISQEKVRFYINMSHELRTPLSLILAPLEELTEEKNKFDVPVQQKLSYVYRNGRKLLHLVNQLLDFRKAESGALPIHVAMSDVDELAGNVFAMFKENAQKRNITYQFHSDLNGSLLPIDKTYVEMMLTNLLSNAFKFTPNGGEIALSIWRKEHSFGFSIKDSGIGISPEKLSRIFERFYQSNEDRKGSGIGLSLVKCLVEKHHGNISVDSKPSQGSEFVIELPSDIQEFSPTEIASPQEENSSEWQTSSLATETMAEDGEFPETNAGQDGQEEGQTPNDITETILLVDDNKEMVDYLKNHFKSKYITLTAGNGEEALAILKEQKVDIVLSDVMMPGIDGIKLCELIKKNMQTCHIPVILLSAKGSIEAQTAGIRIGADDYIPKPFSINLLKGKINNILKAKQRLRHYYSNTIDIDTAKMTSNALDEEFMTKAILIVEENIDDENFTADDLAEKLFMSRSSLYLKMNSVSGEPPANFIRRIRFNKACKLLLEGRYSISEISSKVGFSSASYFSTSFKKYMGCLPSDYVKNQGKKRD